MASRCITQLDSALILQKEGEDIGTLCVVVAGRSHMWELPREKILRLIESGVAAIRKQEE